MWFLALPVLLGLGAAVVVQTPAGKRIEAQVAALFTAPAAVVKQKSYQSAFPTPAAPLPANLPAVRGIYSSQPSDSLTSIASKAGVVLSNLGALNPGLGSGALVPGTPIRIPSARFTGTIAQSKVQTAK